MSQLTESLNQLLADSLVFYVKLHNYHWNVAGPHFELIHKKTESIYEYFSTLYDDVAERILQLGDKPIVTMHSILERSQLQEEPHDNFNDREVLHGIIHDMEAIYSHIKNITGHKDCDAITVAFLEEQCAHFEKELWILKTTLN